MAQSYRVIDLPADIYRLALTEVANIRIRLNRIHNLPDLTGRVNAKPCPSLVYRGPDISRVTTAGQQLRYHQATPDRAAAQRSRSSVEYTRLKYADVMN